jgi:ATPase subunit of ABC transporter with duplicated ATPase domains
MAVEVAEVAEAAANDDEQRKQSSLADMKEDAQGKEKKKKQRTRRQAAAEQDAERSTAERPAMRGAGRVQPRPRPDRKKETAAEAVSSSCKYCGRAFASVKAWCGHARCGDRCVLFGGRFD